MEVVTRFPRRVRERPTVWIPMRDGVRLAARLWLPADTGRNPVPAVLNYNPYRQRDATAQSDEQLYPYVAGHGYACLRLDIRGTGDSEGVLKGEYLRQEHEDALDAIAWIARQPWCTGSVGMMGISWCGFNALQVAALRPPALKAIVTVDSTDDRYADDIHTMGGCILDDHATWAATMFAFDARPPDPTVVGERWRDQWMERLEANEPWLLEWLAHQRRDGFWKHGSVCEDYAAIQCAVYAVGGWADGYTNAVPRLLANLSCPRRGLIGPWGHAYPHDGGPGPAIGWLQDLVRWWDHWLKGIDTGIMAEPMLRVWMQDAVRPGPLQTSIPGRWVAEEAWPSPRIAPRRYALNADGTLADRPGAEAPLLLRSPLTAGLESGQWCPYGHSAELPHDQRADDGRGLVFDGPPLAERLEILGAPVVELDVASDKSVATLAVRLCDVAPDGASLRVSFGLLNLTHRDGHEHPAPLEPGRRTRVRVRLNDIAHAFPPGHRIRVAVTSGYAPLALPPPEIATLTLWSGTGALTLPVRPPRAADAALPPFQEPACAAMQPVTILEPEEVRETVIRDLASGVIGVDTYRSRGRYTLESIGMTYGATCREVFRVAEHDPATTQRTCHWTITLDRPGWAIRIEARTRCAATRDSFAVGATLEAFEGGRRVFARTWDEAIPRHLV